jgi:hypothetical protein
LVERNGNIKATYLKYLDTIQEKSWLPYDSAWSGIEESESQTDMDCEYPMPLISKALKISN